MSQRGCGNAAIGCREMQTWGDLRAPIPISTGRDPGHPSYTRQAWKYGNMGK